MKPLEVLLRNLPYFPVYIAWLVGAILALVRWHRHPRVSLVMLIATALFILGMLLQVVSVAWVMNQISTGGWSASEVGYVMGTVAIVHSLLNTAAYTGFAPKLRRGGRKPGILPTGAPLRPPNGSGCRLFLPLRGI
jgi:hypothetical protein